MVTINGHSLYKQFSQFCNSVFALCYFLSAMLTITTHFSPPLSFGVRGVSPTSFKNSSNWQFFKHNLKGLGYEIVRNDDYKHISVIAYGWKRPVRLDSLGTNYTIDAIRERLDYNRKTRAYFIPVYRAETSPLLRLERELEFKIEHSHDAVTVIVDTLFYILLQLINLTNVY